MPSRPNVLLILTDQHAPRIAGFAGDPIVDTSNLDRLAQRSVWFPNASCASPLCTPSRMCMLTAKEVHRCSAWSNHWVLFPEHVTWPHHFAENGYATCLVGKMHFGGRDQYNGFQRRPYGDHKHALGHQPEPLKLFPAYYGAEGAGQTEIPESLISDVVITRETLSWVLEHRDSQPDQPWLCVAGYTRPHSPFTAPSRYIRKYRDRVPPPSPVEPVEQLDEYSQVFARNSGSMRMSADQVVRGREGYYAGVDFVDDCIGELLDGLGKAGALDNTFVIYSSDHGEMAGVHGLWGKGVFHEPSMGVPLLVSGPDIEPGVRENCVVSLMDLFPTTCGLCGLDVPDGLDGVDCSSLLSSSSGSPRPREFAPSAYYRYGVRINHGRTPIGQPNSAMRAVRTPDWKYVEIQGGSPLLFDMRNDPHETTNLVDAPECADRCREMREMVFLGFSWDLATERLRDDLERVKQFGSGIKPTSPNQYVLPDGRMFDAEASLYEARWLPVPPNVSGGIIPQQFG